jgi:hypothetical protein
MMMSALPESLDRNRTSRQDLRHRPILVFCPTLPNHSASIILPKTDADHLAPMPRFGAVYRPAVDSGRARSSAVRAGDS